MQSIVRNLHYALRQVRKSPVFTLAVMGIYGVMAFTVA
jgi:hypothetical protein